MTRVVVTGMGIVSPLGLDATRTWEGLVAGRSGVGYITRFDPHMLETHFGAEVVDFDPEAYIDRKEARRMDRYAQFAVAAAIQAVEHAGLRIDDSNAYDIGVIIGSGAGGISSMLEQYEVLLDRGAARVSPFLAPMMIADMGPGQIAINLGIKGPNFCTVSSCASGSDAIGTSFETIRRGDAQAMLAGGGEAALIPLGLAAFQAARALSTRNDEPQKACRPFDAERDGLVVGEGAAVLILEELDYALCRGAPILAEILSYGATADAFHVTAPAPGGEGGARAMALALKKAGLKPEDIDYINAHGTATVLNDLAETAAIKTALGDHAHRVAISSSKSMIGHLLGAAGAIEAAITILSIQNGMVHPTINLTHPDPKCDLDYVPNTARKLKVRTGMSNAFGFGGHNSVLVFGEYRE